MTPAEQDELLTFAYAVKRSANRAGLKRKASSPPAKAGAKKRSVGPVVPEGLAALYA